MNTFTSVCFIFTHIKNNDENTNQNFTLKRIYQLNYIIDWFELYNTSKKPLAGQNDYWYNLHKNQNFLNLQDRKFDGLW